MRAKTLGRTRPFRQGIQGVDAGWGGRDRTSEWRNQNPLPYRLATPQLAVLETAEGHLTADSRRHRPSIEGGQAFQQPGRQNPSHTPCGVAPVMESPILPRLGR